MLPLHRSFKSPGYRSSAQTTAASDTSLSRNIIIVHYGSAAEVSIEYTQEISAQNCLSEPMLLRLAVFVSQYWVWRPVGTPRPNGMRITS
jgi:hypothetical protein